MVPPNAHELESPSDSSTALPLVKCSELEPFTRKREVELEPFTRKREVVPTYLFNYTSLVIDSSQSCLLLKLDV